MGTRLLRSSILLLLTTIISLASFSQKNTEQVQKAQQRILSDKHVASVTMSAERQTPSLIAMDTKKAAYKKTAALSLLKNYLSVREGIDELQPGRQTAMKDAVEVLQFQQYFKGIKVDHGTFSALVKNGDIQFFNGAWFTAPADMSVQPAITEAQALASAKSAVGATKYAWEEAQEYLATATDVNLRASLNKELQEYLPKGELVIVKDFSQTVYARVRLAYKFNIYASVPLSREWVYVDAINGKILLIDHILKHVGDPKSPAPPPSVSTTVHTRYAGTQAIMVQQITGTPIVNPALDPNSGLTMVSSHPSTGSDIGYIAGSSTYVLMDDTKGGGIETYDMNAVGGLPVSLPAAVYSQSKAFTDVDNNWDSVEHARGAAYGGANEAENDDIAWDAHWGAGIVYDYWLEKHNRLSFDNNNGKIKSYIHYGPAYDNAFWNGSVMTYGDGSGTGAAGFSALTSLDVCGHEIGHGICSNTSDLAYVGESGAMNEALSDIWAACIEHYAMTRAGSTVPFGKYRSFYIGEQIGADYDHPLRRMDNPKAQSNPDTYGGENWIDPICTATLVNDECGVHTNSGVLNHWFFLLTAGSLNGTRPAGLETASYYTLDSDDELRDAPGSPNGGGSYRVNGVGFDLSEKVTYIMETLLTSTADYNEARAVSIQAATALTGDPCGPLVESVTNAWYAVGVGNAFITPCTTTFGFVYQPGIAMDESTYLSGCTAEKTMYVPVLLPPNSSATITTGGSATINADYTLSATTLTNVSVTDNKQDSVAVTIKNDAAIEADETIDLTVAVTNTGANPVNTNYTITLTDDDVLPVFAADSIVLMNETFADVNTSSPFNMPASWSETLEIPEVSNPDPTATTGYNHWGVINNSIGITGKTALITLPDGTYNPLSASKTIIHTDQKIDARGLNKLLLHFDYNVQGEVDATSGGTAPDDFPVFDYMSVVYSFDGINWMEVSPKGFAALTPTTGTYSALLPAVLNNRQFYFGFRWENDANAGGPVSVSIDNVLLKSAGVRIETDINHNAAENAIQSNEVYYYSVQDRDIIAAINQQDASVYGCITASIENAGNSSFILYSTGTYRHIVGDKIERIIPVANNPSGTYNATLYYTEQEILAIEAATSTPRTSFNMYKTSASVYSGATSANTTSAAVTYNDIPGVGGSFTASFNTGVSGGFAVGAAVAVALPVTCTDFRGVKNSNGVTLQWKVAQEINSNGFELERSTDGSHYTTIAVMPYSNANAGAYSYADNTTGNYGQAFYRLKQIDIDGRYTYLCGILRFRFDDKLFTIGNIYPNPGASAAYVNIYSDKITRLHIEYINVLGQVISTQEEQVQPGSGIIPLKNQRLQAGVYMLRFKDDAGNLLGAQTYIRQ
jgi:Zn-dependent metalloprotease